MHRPVSSGQLPFTRFDAEKAASRAMAPACKVTKATCLFLLAIAALLTTSISAFHGFQTIAPAHGTRAHSLWEGALRSGGQMLAANRTMEELVLPEGYPLENHVVETTDGYLLTVFRIPHGRTPPGGDELNRRRPAVLLQHALLDCSASWVNNGAAASLGFILADAGFDVWLSNSRGNTFSRAHAIYPASSPDFWAFSWDDMAQYDLPASVELVLRATGHQRLVYVGHSQGTTMALAALASQPELADRVSLAVLLAPVTFLGHITSAPLQLLASLGTDEAFVALGAMEFLPSRKAMVDVFGELCRAAPTLCTSAIQLICGYNPDNLNQTRLPLYLSYTPAGTSVQNMVHWAQGVRAPEPHFQRFDYGAACTTRLGLPRRCNLNMYGQPEPPRYNLTRISVPIALFTGGKDKLSDDEDTALLQAALPAGTVVFRHDEPLYEHLDFTWGADAHRRIYPPILALLQKYSGMLGSEA